MDYATSRNFVVGENYIIKPNDISLEDHFWAAFGKTEAEMSAYWIVKMCQDNNVWRAFTQGDIDKFSNHDYCFNGLVDNDFIHETDDEFLITHEFVCRCFLSSPTKTEMTK